MSVAVFLLAAQTAAKAMQIKSKIYALHIFQRHLSRLASFLDQVWPPGLMLDTPDLNWLELKLLISYTVVQQIVNNVHVCHMQCFKYLKYALFLIASRGWLLWAYMEVCEFIHLKKNKKNTAICTTSGGNFLSIQLTCRLIRIDTDDH